MSDGDIYPSPPRIDLPFEGSRLTTRQAVWLQRATTQAVELGFRAGCDGLPACPPITLMVEPDRPAHEADALRRQVQRAAVEGYRWGHHARTGEWTNVTDTPARTPRE